MNRVTYRFLPNGNLLLRTNLPLHRSYTNFADLIDKEFTSLHNVLPENIGAVTDAPIVSNRKISLGGNVCKSPKQDLDLQHRPGPD